MSDFHELIKSFPKIREYVAPYVRKDYVPGGFPLSLAIDSNLLDTNPLFQVWKTKSFTDNDIILHFFILDLLQDGKMLSAEEITDCLLTEYGALFDIQTVRRKCNAYAREGLLHKQKIKKSVFFSLDNTLKREMETTAVCIPLQIFTSARSGRRFLCGYLESSKRFSCFRLDTIKKTLPLEITEKYDELLTKLIRNYRQLWGVSFQGTERHHSDKITMTIRALEPTENYIADRLRREGRGGTVTKIARNTYQYEIEVFDCNEMLPWIRTFIGRILSFHCTAKSVENRFYADLHVMYRMYGIEEDCADDNTEPKRS